MNSFVYSRNAYLSDLDLDDDLLDCAAYVARRLELDEARAAREELQCQRSRRARLGRWRGE